MRALETLGGLIVAIAIGIGFFRLTILMLAGATTKNKTNDEEEKNG